MTLTRARALAVLGAAPLLGRCALDRAQVRVGSKNFTESFLIAEIYAQALERAGLRVGRLFNLGSTQIAMAAMQRGNIDLLSRVYRHRADRRAPFPAGCAIPHGHTK